jgi:predicted MPP superfamily phosphohydrolase
VALPGGGTLTITGLSRGNGRQRDPAWLARLLDRGPRGDHHVVISHAPDFVDAMPQPVDLVLAGHTHGGQVVLPLVGALKTGGRLPRRYAGGLNDYGGIPLHVSRGIGMERGFDVPIRFLCPPEICVLDLRLPRGGQRVQLSRAASGSRAASRRLPSGAALPGSFP